MECPKCHKIIADNSESCPHCHKVFTLVCPNCHTLSQDSTCPNCGYIILEKCSKCGKMVSTSAKSCKCGLPIQTSIAYQECETDEFASINIKFCGLKAIRRVLASAELYSKFLIKLKNLLKAQFKNIDGKIIKYNDEYVINLNKELSFPTSANKAIRYALKIANSFTELNKNIIEELNVPLKLTITVLKKNAEELLINKSYESKVRLLTVKRNEPKYYKSMQIILDQYVQDCINRDYKTDSLYSIDSNGQSLMFYEIILQNYILPPNKSTEDSKIETKNNDLKKKKSKKNKDDLYEFKVFDLNTKCIFEKSTPSNVFSLLDSNVIISLKCEDDNKVSVSELMDYYSSKNIKPLYAVCSEITNFKPWGVFEQLFREYYKLSPHSGFVSQNFDPKPFTIIKNFLKGLAKKAATPEDARFAYMEEWGNFLASLKNSVIIIDGFEYIDDTTLQTLDVYFDRFKKINVHFLFITNKECPVHAKFKGLLRTPFYTEISIIDTTVDSLISEIKEDASDFIQSFYYEKINENYNGSKMYFNNALEFLKEKDVLISFENKLLIKNNNSVILPANLKELLKARLKNLSKYQDASLILAYSVYLGERMDLTLLNALGIKDLESNLKILYDKNFIYIKDDIIHINNYTIICSIIKDSLKKEAETFVSKNILAKISKGMDNTSLALLLDKLSMIKEEYMLLWKNSQFAMAVGDFDAYLKNCLSFLSIIENIGEKIPREDIEKNKKEVYQNILISLYRYSPEKIYSIENILLIDAINKNDDDKIIQLSNLMLQGALISANYTDAKTLLYNILTRIPNPKLVVDGQINTKFLLLSLINIEILFNTGKYQECSEIAEDLLDVIKPEIIEKIKPVNFSMNLFVSHMLETFRLAGLAKLIMSATDLYEFFEKIKNSFNTELPDKDCIIAIKDYLSGKDFVPSNIEESTPFTKIVYLILQEMSLHNNDYKTFAQNIYQAKLLAYDIHQTQLELYCDLLIANSYANMNIPQKANAIYNDILDKSEKSAIFGVSIITKYFIAKQKFKNCEYDEALLIVNNALADIQKDNNQAALFYVIFEKLLIDIVKQCDMSSINIENENQKIQRYIETGDFSRLIEQTAAY